MRARVLILPLASALGLLAGCSSDNGATGVRPGSSAAEDAEVPAKLKSLSENLRSLERRVDELDGQNRRLEKMLAIAEQDLRSRLKEMVQQEAGAGGRPFMPRGERGVRPPVLPRAYLGFDGETHEPETAKKLGLPVKTGVLVSAVTEGAPADVAGLQKGDILQSVNDKPVATREELIQVFGELRPGQDCQLDVVRGEERLKLNVKAGAR